MIPLSGEPPPDDRLAEWLEAYDEALAWGEDPDAAVPEDLAKDPAWRMACDNLRLLEEVWPRAEGHPPAGPRAGRLPERLGRFRVVAELGRGGFGVVYLAFDPRLKRQVALKVPHSEIRASTETWRRFELEAQAASRLHHPGIIPVHEIVEAEGGFIVSEYQEGPTLADWRRQHEPVPLRQAAELVAALADAVQHAHEKGILHRDLKPSNVLLRLPGPDRGGIQPRICDFGLAKLLDHEAGETLSGEPLGSPSYMAPEQAEGRRRDLGSATDVYALGVILYELLVGRPPHQGETLQETLRQVIATDPVPPGRLRTGMPRDLEVICLTCLEKVPARRYATAAALADDLTRFLRDEPIRARPPGPWLRAWKWARRRPRRVALAAASVLALIGVVGGLLIRDAELRAHDAELQARDERLQQSNRNLSITRDQLRAANQDLSRALGELEEKNAALREREQDVLRLWSIGQIRRAEQYLDAGDVELAEGVLDEPGPIAEQPDPHGFAWNYLKRQCRRQVVRLAGHPAGVSALAVAPDGRTLASGDHRGQVLFWDLARPSGPRRPPTPESGPGIRILAFSPDGRSLVSVGAHEESGPTTLRIWEVDSGRVRSDLSAQVGHILGVGIGDEGRSLVTVEAPSHARGDPVKFWDLTPGRDVPGHRDSGGLERLAIDPDEAAAAPRDRLTAIPWRVSRLHGLAVTTDRSILVAGRGAGPLVLTDTRTGARLATCWIRGDEVLAIPEVMSDERLEPKVTAATGHARVRVLRSQDFWPLMPPREPGLLDRVRGLAILTRNTMAGDRSRLHAALSPDGTRLAVGGTTPPPSLWDVPARRKRAEYRLGETGVIGAVAFTPDGTTPVLGGEDRRLRLWRFNPPPEPMPRGHRWETWALAFSPDGRTLASAGDDWAVRLWDVATGRSRRRPLLGHLQLVSALAYAPDGKTLASAGFDKTVRLWDLTGDRPPITLSGHTGHIRSIAYSPDGTTLATTGDDTTVRLWDVAGRRLRATRPLSDTTDMGRAVAFSPDGKTLAAAGGGPRIVFWDWARDREPQPQPTGEQPYSLDYSPDGRYLAVPTTTGPILLWDVARGRFDGAMTGHRLEVRSVAFSHDGRTLASGGQDQTLRIWDVATRREMLTLKGHESPLHAVAFSPDDQVLASGSHDGAIRFWRASDPDPNGG